MIGLGLRNRATSGHDDPEVGMLDVSANALAVLILATMLVISAAVPPSPRGEVRREDVPELFYPSPLEAAFAPQNRYVIVAEQGLVELDLDAFAFALAKGSVSATTAQGQATLVTDRRRYRDLNDYRLSIAPDWQALSSFATALDPDTLAKESKTAHTLFEHSNTATTYLVTTGAIDAFSPLYWLLREAQTPIRWATVPQGQKIILTRRVENFERRTRQWQ